MRLFAILDNNKLSLTNNFTDEYFFNGKVVFVKDYVQDCGDYMAIKKGNNFDIYNMEEYINKYGEDKFHMFDEEAYFSCTAKC